MSPLRLVALYGTGDVYLVCALAPAVAAVHGRPVTVVVKQAHAAIPALFGLAYAIDDVLVRRGEGDGELHRLYENDIGRALNYFVHPHFLRSGVRIDRLTVKPSVSQADMYRALLHLPVDTPLALPRIPAVAPVPGTVLIMPEAGSWPNTQPEFWRRLGERLVSLGLSVSWHDRAWSLGERLERCAASEWVIGPQRGTMAMLCAARFPCRKTFVTPSVDGGRYPGLPVPGTFPYAYVSKFTGEDFEVDEFKITDDNHTELIDKIAACRQGGPARLEPVLSIAIGLSPGDFLDRLAVLQAKMTKLPPHLRQQIARRYERYREAFEGCAWNAAVRAQYAAMVDIHRQFYDLHERFVPDVIAGARLAAEDHETAVRLNKRRIELRQQIDAACGSAFSEIKSYYAERGA